MTKQSGSHGVFFPHTFFFLSINNEDNPRKLLVCCLCGSSNPNKKRQLTQGDKFLLLQIYLVFMVLSHSSQYDIILSTLKLNLPKLTISFPSHVNLHVYEENPLTLHLPLSLFYNYFSNALFKPPSLLFLFFDIPFETP